jgi:hypothetical protein
VKNERRTASYIHSAGKLKQTCSRDDFAFSSFILVIFCFLKEFLVLIVVVTDKGSFLLVFLELSRVVFPSWAYIKAGENPFRHSEKCQEKERRTLRTAPRSRDPAGPDSSSLSDASTECFDEATGPTELAPALPSTWPPSSST